MDSAQEFLDKLVGTWDLTGQMGKVALQESVAAQWTLGGLFVEMHFRSTLPAKVGEIPYEAVYFVGHHAEHDLYVLHLLDTFGVPPVIIPGIGKRDGNAIPFVFQYDAGPFTNRFVYEPFAGSWQIEQSYIKEGERLVFATKQMTRR
jgi:hypothetical protein